MSIRDEFDIGVDGLVKKYSEQIDIVAEFTNKLVDSKVIHNNFKDEVKEELVRRFMNDIVTAVLGRSEVNKNLYEIALQRKTLFEYYVDVGFTREEAISLTVGTNSE